MMDPTRPYLPPQAAPLPASSLPIPGIAAPFAFTTLEGLMAHYSQWLPSQYVQNLVEAEKEIFVVRKECSLQETRLQFLKKCESALTRSLAEIQSGRANLDWSYIAPPAP
jgi:hypothetical protein